MKDLGNKSFKIVFEVLLFEPTTLVKGGDFPIENDQLKLMFNPRTDELTDFNIL